MSRPKRSAAIAARSKFWADNGEEEDDENLGNSASGNRVKKRKTTHRAPDVSVDSGEETDFILQEEASSSSSDQEDNENKNETPPRAKRQRTSRSYPVSERSENSMPGLSGASVGDNNLTTCTLNSIPEGGSSILDRPLNHTPSYHTSLLLSDLASRQSLLSWFDAVSHARSMPWRKPWINSSCPSHKSSPNELRTLLEKRAYEVWISEIMLQQTRVATVISYWNKWMSLWPTIHDLAGATHDDVLAAWKGLGYYSRATRIHTAAKFVVEHPDWKGLLPSDVGELQKKVPGVGRYTAGAVSAIVFGKAEPLVDGNVLRVLSRQLGVFGDIKSDKRVIDAIWDAADRLVKKVARDGDEEEENGNEKGQEPPLSDKPGRWGQALMELGSTVCTPTSPNCAACPITATCQAFGEGFALAARQGEVPISDDSKSKPLEPPARPPPQTRGVVLDIEDICTLCDPSRDQVLLFRKPNQSNPNLKTVKTKSLKSSKTELPPKALSVITSHVEKYPPKKTGSQKKKLAEQESQVFAIWRTSDGKFLIQRRPANGLLANMWEFPSFTFDSRDDTGKARHPVLITSPPGGSESKSGSRSGSESGPGSVPAAVSNSKRQGKRGSKPRESLKNAKVGVASAEGSEIIPPTKEETSEAESRALEILTTSDLLISPPKITSLDSSGTITLKTERRWSTAPNLKHVGELGIIPWTFSHIKMSMYVQLFELDDKQVYPSGLESGDGSGGESSKTKWIDKAANGRERWVALQDFEEMTMGTGMKKCLGLVKEAVRERDW